MEGFDPSAAGAFAMWTEQQARTRRVAELRAMQTEMEAAHAQHDLPNYYRVNRAIHDRINAADDAGRHYGQRHGAGLDQHVAKPFAMRRQHQDVECGVHRRDSAAKR